MTNDSTEEKIKEKAMGAKDKVKETIGMGGDKVKETIGMGGGDESKKGEKEELGPGAATRLEEEVAKTSSDSPTRRVEGVGKALGKEKEDSE
jgi:hypothetical protein